MKDVFFTPLKFVVLFVLLCIFSNCSETENNVIIVPLAEEPEVEVQESTEPEEPWNLIWEDDFDTDLSDWNIWEGGAFNNEIQLYRPEQLDIQNGILTITIQREAITGPNNPFDATPKDFEYVSGRIESKTVYGPSDSAGEEEYRFMARIKLPPGNGMWPAFWSYADPWPTKGEIDILEARGNLPTKFASNIFYGEEPGVPLTRNENTAVEYDLNVDLTADFHVYELIWTADSLEIIFDGSSLQKYEANNQNYIASIFGNKQQIVLNTAVGGDYFQNAPSANFVDQSQMQVDWVRVYKR